LFRGGSSAEPLEDLFHVCLEAPATEDRKAHGDQPAAKGPRGPHGGDVDPGAARGCRKQLGLPATTWSPGIRLERADRSLAGLRVPVVAVAFPGQDVAFGDIGPIGT